MKEEDANFCSSIGIALLLRSFLYASKLLSGLSHGVVLRASP